MKVLRYGMVVSAAVLLACPAPARDDRGTVTVPARRDRGPVEPAAGGRVHVVQMISDREGNRFEPADLEVRPGDVIRWRLESGVHNAHFVRDSNPGSFELPARTPMLQREGETFDTVVLLHDGAYYFHCDPHAMLGMAGQLIVAR